MMKHSSHKVGFSCWHFVWATKYRYKMMRKPENKNIVAAAIRRAACAHHIMVRELEVMPDHIHMLAVLPHTMTDSKALQLLKGCSAHTIFRVKENYRLRYPKGHFWSPGGCAITVGHSDYQTTVDYIRNQQAHHAKT